MPHRGKITISMREYKLRNGRDTEALRKEIQDGLKGIYPGVAISVEKDQIAPPSGYPINIEIEGKDYDVLINTAEQMRNFLNTKNIEALKTLFATIENQPVTEHAEIYQALTALVKRVQDHVMDISNIHLNCSNS